MSAQEKLVFPATHGTTKLDSSIAGSQTLRSIIRSARLIIVAPLITGGYQTSTLLSTGQYLSALKCAAASGAAFVTLTIALAIADIIGQSLYKARGSPDQEDV